MELKTKAPVVGRDDVEAALWRLLAAVAAGRRPVAEIARVLLVVREYAIACGADAGRLDLGLPGLPKVRKTVVPVEPRVRSKVAAVHMASAGMGGGLLCAQRKRDGGWVTGLVTDVAGDVTCGNCKRQLTVERSQRERRADRGTEGRVHTVAFAGSGGEMPIGGGGPVLGTHSVGDGNGQVRGLAEGEPAAIGDSVVVPIGGAGADGDGDGDGDVLGDRLAKRGWEVGEPRACGACGIVKDEGDFSKDANNWDGRKRTCRPCDARRRAQLRAQGRQR